MTELPLLAFALSALIVVMTPGPTVLLALSNGSRFGFRRSGYGVLGAAISDAILIAAVALGLGAVLAASAFWFAVIKWLGVGYLVWLGVQMLRSSGELKPLDERVEAGSAKDRRTNATIFSKSLLVAVTNPKGYLFFAAFLPQFLAPASPLLLQYLTLAAVFIAVDVAVMAVYAAVGARATRALSREKALWMDRVCGGFLIALAGGLALVRRDAV